MRNIFVCCIFLLSISTFAQTEEIKDLELLVINDQYDQAIESGKELLQGDTLQSKIYYLLGKAYKGSFKFFDAIVAFESALEYDSANVVYETALAEVYDVVGRDKDAMDIYFEQYGRDTLTISPIMNLANLFKRRREYPQALTFYGKASQVDTTNFYFFKQLAYCFDQLGYTGHSILNYQKAIQYNPNDLGLYLAIGNVCIRDRRFEGAMHFSQQGLEIDSLNIPLMKQFGYSNYMNHNFDTAIEVFNQIFEMGDSSSFTYKFQGLAYFENMQFDSAKVKLLNAFKLDDQDVETAFYLGSAEIRSGDFKKGTRHLGDAARIIKADPKDLADIYDEMSKGYYEQKNYHRSLELLKEAYKLDARPVFSFKMGQLYDYHFDNKKMAINYYDGYLQMINSEDVVADSAVVAGSTIPTTVNLKTVAKERIQKLNEELFFEGKEVPTN